MGNFRYVVIVNEDQMRTDEREGEGEREREMEVRQVGPLAAEGEKRRKLMGEEVLSEDEGEEC